MRDGLAGIAAVGAMIACCAVLSFAVGAIGGLTLGAALGWNALAAAVILVCLAFIVRRYREGPKA